MRQEIGLNLSQVGNIPWVFHVWCVFKTGRLILKALCPVKVEGGEREAEGRRQRKEGEKEGTGTHRVGRGGGGGEACVACL